MKEELKDLKAEWTKTVRSLDIPAESIYILLNPVDRSEFIKLVNELANEMFKLKQNGSVDKDVVRNFKLLAIQYLIEFEKENTSYIPTPSTYPINLPSSPTYPTAPNVSHPYQLPVIYCSTVS